MAYKADPVEQVDLSTDPAARGGGQENEIGRIWPKLVNRTAEQFFLQIDVHQGCGYGVKVLNRDGHLHLGGGSMRALDVMTKHVLTVNPNTSVRELAALLSANGVSGVPVVDEANHVIGIVSEGDLIHRAEIGTERETKRRPSWWLNPFASDLAPDYVKSHGRKVADVMTRDVISISETTELASVATLLETNGIKRVPVLKNGKLVGLISRANLVRALAASEAVGSKGSDADEEIIRNRVQDELIRKQLLDELSKMGLARTTWAPDVIVKDQKVHLWFSEDQTAEQRRALHIAAENTPHVRSVEEHIVPGGPALVF